MFATLAASKTQVQTTSVLAAIRTLKTVQNVSIVHEWYNSIQVNHTVFTRMSKFTIFQNAWMILFRVCSLCMNNWIVCHRFCLLCMNVLITVCSLCNNKTNYQLFVITLIGYQTQTYASSQVFICIYCCCTETYFANTSCTCVISR